MKNKTSMKMSIDITPYFEKERNRIKYELINHIKSKWLDIDIDEDMEDEDITYLFTVVYEHGDDEDNLDTIRFDFLSDDSINYYIETIYEMDKGIYRKIENIDQLDEIIELLINNVKKGIISEIPEWIYDIESDDEFITRDISELDIDLN